MVFHSRSRRRTPAWGAAPTSAATATSIPVFLALTVASAALGGCSGGSGQQLPPASFVSSQAEAVDTYVIGPMDHLTIFVWRNPELGGKVQVRPDGRITTPLITDMQATGKTPTQLAEDIARELGQYVQSPRVSVIVDNFSGTFAQQVRVVGATEKPSALPYRADMTLLDAIIAVGGLSQNADGNRARLIRTNRETGEQQTFDLKIDRLLHRGDASANVRLQPGDVIIVPTSMF